MALERIREMLADLPEIGSIRCFNNKELDGLRMLRIPKFEKYLIFYRPVLEGTEIIRVLHAARDISSIFGEREIRGIVLYTRKNAWHPIQAGKKPQSPYTLSSFRLVNPSIL